MVDEFRRQALSLLRSGYQVIFGQGKYISRTPDSDTVWNAKLLATEFGKRAGNTLKANASALLGELSTF